MYIRARAIKTTPGRNCTRDAGSSRELYYIASNHSKTREKYSENTASSHNSIGTIIIANTYYIIILSYIILAGQRGEGGNLPDVVYSTSADRPRH